MWIFRHGNGRRHSVQWFFQMDITVRMGKYRWYKLPCTCVSAYLYHCVLIYYIILCNIHKREREDISPAESYMISFAKKSYSCNTHININSYARLSRKTTLAWRRDKSSKQITKLYWIKFFYCYYKYLKSNISLSLFGGYWTSVYSIVIIYYHKIEAESFFLSILIISYLEIRKRSWKCIHKGL